MNNIIMLILAVVSMVAVVYAFTKAKHPFLTAGKSAFCGIASLLIINLTSAATGCYIAVNYFTAFVATVLSLPGVIALLFFNVMFG